MIEFQVKKADLNSYRSVDVDTPTAGDGEIVVKVDRFAFTANNITYGVAGDMIGYWQFFPPHGEDTEGWGVLPVWGFADVVESNAPDIPVGDRFYGYFPPATHLKMKPVGISPERFMDGSEHRSQLPPGYNAYQRVKADPTYKPEMDNQRALLFPLHITSFCLWDALNDADWRGAEQILVLSASSKTSIGLGQFLSDDADAPTTIGLTSARNADFVNSLGFYDECLTYDELDKLDTSKPTVMVDMSGNASLLGQLHKALGDNMNFCINVGMTHWEEGGGNPDIIADRSEFFFAPGHIQKRMKDWGPDGFAQKSTAFMTKSAMKSGDWMKVKELSGIQALEGVYLDVCNGKVAPEEGLIVKL